MCIVRNDHQCVFKNLVLLLHSHPFCPQKPDPEDDEDDMPPRREEKDPWANTLKP